MKDKTILFAIFYFSLTIKLNYLQAMDNKDNKQKIYEINCYKSEYNIENPNTIKDIKYYRNKVMEKTFKKNPIPISIKIFNLDPEAFEYSYLQKVWILNFYRSLPFFWGKEQKAPDNLKEFYAKHEIYILYVKNNTRSTLKIDCSKLQKYNCISEYIKTNSVIVQQIKNCFYTWNQKYFAQNQLQNYITILPHPNDQKYIFMFVKKEAGTACFDKLTIKEDTASKEEDCTYNLKFVFE